jgi:hypothetical protein
MLPVYPLNVNIVLFVPDATDPEPLIVPDAEPRDKVMACVVVELPLVMVIVPVYVPATRPAGMVMPEIEPPPAAKLLAVEA